MNIARTTIGWLAHFERGAWRRIWLPGLLLLGLLAGHVGLAQALTTVYEAEDATLSGPRVATNHVGYSGTGFADFGTTVGEYIEWTVTAAVGGPVTLDFRYANGSNIDRPLELRVNGVVVDPSLSFPQTGNWDTWGTVSVNVVLNPGANTIRVTSIINNGPNMDYLAVTEPDTPTPSPTPLPTATPTATPTPAWTPTPSPTPLPSPTPTSGPSPTPSPTPTPGATFEIPHGGYLTHPNRCATCHRIHTGQGPRLLFVSAVDNAFCYTCHDGTGASAATIVSTHGNNDFSGREEAVFGGLKCTQCHDPHGTGNLYAIREEIRLTDGASPITDGPVSFTATTGSQSYDDGASPYNERLCTVCHANTANPGYPMTNHVGGANHLGGYDFTGQDCTSCHPHSADADRFNEDGFMPIGGCTICHSVAQDNGDGVPPGGRRAVVPEFSYNSHHVNGAVTDDDCRACHYIQDHTSGYVKLYDADNPANVIVLNGDPRTDPAEAAKLEAFCLACHDGDGAGGFAPFSDGTMPPVVDATLWNAGAHKNAGSTTCFDCHDNGHGSNKARLLAPFDYTNDGDPDDPLRQEERFCYQCHDGSVAATDVQAEFGRSSHHNVALTDQADGSKVECIHCHDPHTASATAKVINPDTGAPWSGALTAFCLTCHDGAPPAGVTFAGGGTGSAVSPHSNQDVTPVEGPFATECRQCHEPHGADNLALIRSQVEVTTGITVGPITFTATSGPNSYDDGTSPATSRICVACHQDPNNPGYPMTNHEGGAGHGGGLDFTASDCTLCHPHDVDGDSSTLDGFMPDPKCTGCHQFPLGTRRQIVGTGGDFSRTSHHVQGTVTDDDCKVCHEMSQHQGGTVRLYDVDTGAVIPYTGGAIPEAFCLACHDADGANGNTTPFSDGVLVPDINAGWSTSSHAAGLTCYDCHDNGHGSNKIGLLATWNAAPDGDPDDPMRQEERFCYQCHDGSVASTDIQSEFNRATHHDVALTDQNASGAKVECINCHNPHLDNAANQNINPDNWYQPWTGARRDFCLTCHDGSPPTGTGPAPAVTFPAGWQGTGYDKSAYLGSAHDSLLGNWGCSHCHDEHGSNNLATLLDTYVVTDYNNYALNDYALCWTCHIEPNVMSWNKNDRNHFKDLHKKHVSGERAPCVICHDPHAPWDAGEPGLISFDVAYRDGYDNYDFQILNGYNLSSAFGYDAGANRGYCYVNCHGVNHNPKQYDRFNLLTYDCTACHPGGPPPP